jgi:hypothetical protein
VPRPAAWLLYATLFLWRPLDFAIEVPSTLPSIGQRGLAGALELLLHGAVAALAIAAIRAISNGLPSARGLAATALVASALTTIQSHYWSVLPHQTMPSDRLPLAAAGVVVAILWLVYLGRNVRDEQRAANSEPRR